ncbi:MAG: hypothetical protein RIF33_05055 [Cyclobacteriaceae bacterium]
MPNSEKILTLHPAGKKGVNISLEKYEQVRKVLLDIVSNKPKITFSDMADLAEQKLTVQQFDGKPLWYITTIKLDLEARGIIGRVPKTSPHQLIVK